MLKEKLNGYHKLSGVDNDGVFVRFTLDGITYEYETKKDSCDNTYMEGPRVVNNEVKNKFLECVVKCKYSEDLNSEHFCGIEMIDDVSKKEVLTIGTDHSYEYHPVAWFEFYPENLAGNQVKDLKKDPIKRKTYKTGHNRQR